MQHDAVPKEHRHQECRRIHLDQVIRQNPARCPNNLHLIFCIAVVQHDINARQAVKRDLARENFRFDRLAVQERSGLSGQFPDRRLAASGYCLPDAHLDTPDTDCVVEGLDGSQHLDGGGIGAGDNALS